MEWQAFLLAAGFYVAATAAVALGIVLVASALCCVIDGSREFFARRRARKRADEIRRQAAEALVGLSPEHAQPVGHEWLRKELAKETGLTSVSSALRWLHDCGQPVETGGGSKGVPYVLWRHPEHGWVRCDLGRLV